MTTLTTAGAAAEQLAAQLPSATPLTVAPLDAALAPAADAACVRAHFVGATSADLMVVADDAVAAALAAAGDGVSAAEILRPALEAAASTLGAGVLDTARSEPLGDALADAETEAYALVDAAGTPQAWFAMRVRAAAAAPTVPASSDPAAQRARMRVLQDVELVLTAEIGRTRLPMRQVLDLVPGTVLELDRNAGAPADVMVNGRLVARGEVVVIDEDYGIRISEIVSDGAI
ncbi:flagellar motor switch protein FliN [Demequina mangrovi]|uniref:Flagellar motor switch protein FliN/FliY n=1 Tax=Demequina mangrovi TaxID=1043493 RepID=A0A1H6ZTM4_9MICO|nr:flagellar motor switch protein FliN [Demequina mangrovi]SEJ55986.1 flagellar motor switch protein FliN/FliY [Demequina mangrovi]